MTADQRAQFDTRMRAFRSQLADAESIDDLANAMSYLGDCIELATQQAESHEQAVRRLLRDLQDARISRPL